MEIDIPDLLPFYKGRGVIMSSRSSVVAINWADENSGTALHWTLLQMALIKAAYNYMSDFVNTGRGFILCRESYFEKQLFTGFFKKCEAWLQKLRKMAFF